MLKIYRHTYTGLYGNRPYREINLGYHDTLYINEQSKLALCVKRKHPNHLVKNGIVDSISGFKALNIAERLLVTRIPNSIKGRASITIDADSRVNSKLISWFIQICDVNYSQCLKRHLKKWQTIGLLN